MAAERAVAEGDRLRAEWRVESTRRAISKYEEALLHWQAAGDKSEQASALKAIGEIYHSLGEPQKALACFHRALRLSQETNDRRREGEILSHIGYVYVNVGESQKALESCTKALEISRAVNNRRGEAQALNGLGEVQYAFGNNRKAFDYYQQALPLWRALSDRRGEAQTHLYLGYTYAASDDPQNAFDYYRQALHLWRAANDQRGEALTLVALGHLHSKLGDKQQALMIYDQAMPLVQKVGDRVWQGSILSGMGYIYVTLGDKNRALDYYRQALRTYQAASYRRGEANSLITIGRIYSSMGEYQKALTSFQRSLSMSRTMAGVQSFALNNIGTVYEALGDQMKALVYYSRALRYYQAEKSRRGEAEVLQNMGRVYHNLAKKKRALDCFSKAFSLYREAGDRFGEASTLYNLAHVKQDLGTLIEARTDIQAALQIVETLRAVVASEQLRTSYFATAQQNYELYLDLLMRLHKEHPSEGLDAVALHVSERARARSLLDLLSEARVDLRQGVDPSLLESERALQQQVEAKERARIQLLSGKHTSEQAAAAEKELSELLAQYEDIRAQIRAKSPRYAALTQPQPLTLREIQQQALDADTMLLEYSLGEERSYLWAVSSTSLNSFELPKRAVIEQAARLVYELLTARSRSVKGETLRQQQWRIGKADAEFLKAAMALSQMVLGPVADQLGNKRLLIVADGALQYVPFAALPAPSMQGSKGAEGPGSRGAREPGGKGGAIKQQVLQNASGAFEK